MNIATQIITRVADVNATQDVVRAYVQPTMIVLFGLATLLSTLFLVIAGVRYMSSTGKPEQLEQAKHILRNALIGLVIVIAAATLTAVLAKAYGSPTATSTQTLPSLQTIDNANTPTSIVDLLIKSIIGLFKYIVETAGKPFISAVEYFTRETSLIAENAGVFRLWLVTVALADGLFVLVLALLGFHVMSASALGLDELDLKRLAPQLIFTFLLINTSIFAIDAVITISNVMIKAVNAGFNSASTWQVLSKISDGYDGMGLVALMIMVVFLTLTVILLVYYVMRLVILYLGAVLAPIIILLAVLPGFKDFVMTAVKTYVATIFVLFVHVIILTLAASLFATTLIQDPTNPNPLMAMLIGIATLITLLKTQGVLMQMSYVSAGPRALRKLGGQFMNGVSYTTSKMKAVKTARAVK